MRLYYQRGGGTREMGGGYTVDPMSRRQRKVTLPCVRHSAAPARGVRVCDCASVCVCVCVVLSREPFPERATPTQAVRPLGEKQLCTIYATPQGWGDLELRLPRPPFGGVQPIVSVLVARWVCSFRHFYEPPPRRGSRCRFRRLIASPHPGIAVCHCAQYGINVA